MIGLHRVILVVASVFITSIFLFIGYSVYKLHRQQNQILGDQVVELKKQYLIYSPTERLKYFYESIPDQTQIDAPGWLAHPATYTFNHDGLNERYDYPLVSSPEVFRIVALGDSFTFGQYVDTVDNWPERLEDMLNNECRADIRFEVINLGEPGYDVQYIAHRYAIRGKKYDPDLVIWFESGSGFDRMMELLTPRIQEHLSRASVSGEWKKVPSWREAASDIHEVYSDQQIFWQISASWEEFLRDRGSVNTVIATFEDMAMNDKMKLRYVTRNQSHVWLHTDVSTIYEDDHHRLSDGHPSPIGHQVIANSLFTYVSSQKLISCGKSE